MFPIDFIHWFWESEVECSNSHLRSSSFFFFFQLRSFSTILYVSNEYYTINKYRRLHLIPRYTIVLSLSRRKRSHLLAETMRGSKHSCQAREYRISGPCNGSSSRPWLSWPESNKRYCPWKVDTGEVIPIVDKKKTHKRIRRISKRIARKKPGISKEKDYRRRGLGELDR